MNVRWRELHNVVVLRTEVHQDPAGVPELFIALRTNLPVAVAKLVSHLLPKMCCLKFKLGLPFLSGKCQK